MKGGELAEQARAEDAEGCDLEAFDDSKNLLSAVKSIYASPTNFIRNCKSIAEWVNAQHEKKPVCWEENAVKVAFKMWLQLFRDMKDTEVAVTNWNESQHGPLPFRMTAASTCLLPLLHSYKFGSSTLLAILRASKINPEVFLNKVMEQLLVDKNRGRLLILHSATKMCGKSTMGLALQQLLDGKPLNVDLKRNVDAIFGSVDQKTSGLVILEDISEAGLKLADAKLRSLIDGHNFEADRKYASISTVRWPPCLITTNITAKELEAANIFEKRFAEVEFGLSLDDPRLNYDDTNKTPDNSEIINMFWKYFLFPHCSAYYNGQPSAFSPCYGKKIEDHHPICPLIEVTDSFIDFGTKPDWLRIDSGDGYFMCPSFNHINKDYLLFFMTHNMLEKVFALFLHEEVKGGQIVQTYSEEQLQKETEVVHFFFYLVLPLAKLFHNIYNLHYSHLNMNVALINCNRPVREDFNAALYDLIESNLQKLLAPHNKVKLLFSKYCTPHADRLLLKQVTMNEYKELRYKRFLEYLKEQYMKRMNIELAERRVSVIVPLPNYDFDTTLAILSNSFQIAAGNTKRKLPRHCFI